MYPRYLLNRNSGAQILFRRLTAGLTLGYIPKGPIGKNLEILTEAVSICRNEKAIVLYVEPDCLEEEFDKKNIFAKGFSKSHLSIQPRRTIILSLEGGEMDWQKKMKQKTRYNIRLAMKKEIKIELPNLDRFKEVTLRLAPYPSGPLHIGNSRMVVLNDYLAKKYKGKLYLVFDDTIGSKTKIIDPDAYDSIPEGLDYLDVKVHKTFFKSDRLDLFYDYATQILTKGSAYVCTCDGGTWRTTFKEDKIACPCRSLSIEDNLARWEKMLDGTYPEQGAVVRLKTEMDAPDPAIRDPVMLRISEREHPRVGSKYRVWPLLEFSWGIDDYKLNISHIIRGKDLRKEGVLEERIWDVFQWKKP